MKYTQAVDMWSVGCIFAELLYGKPIFQGKTEVSEEVSPFVLIPSESTLIFLWLQSCWPWPLMDLYFGVED